MGLVSELGAGPVGLDAAIWIYAVEEHPRFCPPLLPLFAAANAGVLPIVSSALVLLEVLIVPLRFGQSELAQRYERALTGSRGLTVVEVSRECLRAAAGIRAATRASTPDALHLATALRAGCTTFLTNDRRLPALPGLRVLQLSDYAA